MKKVIRFTTSLVIFIASFYFIYYLQFALLPFMMDASSNYVILAVPLLSAIGISWFVWRKLNAIDYGFVLHMLLGGVILGAISFVLGFLGPIIFYPDSNQGPLLGFFVTGPVGFLVGLASGGICWFVKKRKSN